MQTQAVSYVIQARLGGTRLPGKIKGLVGGLSILEHVARRGRYMGFDTVISVPPGTEEEWEWTLRWRAHIGVRLHMPRAHEDDVLGRLASTVAYCSREERYAAVVRLTADCPFVPVSAIDAVAAVVAGGGADFCETRSDPSERPNGIDAQAFTPDLLMAADLSELDRSNREHVGPAVKALAENAATIHALEGILLDELPYFSVTVDTPEDLDRVRGIAKWHASGGTPPHPSLTDLVDVHRMRPDLFE